MNTTGRLILALGALAVPFGFGFAGRHTMTIPLLAVIATIQFALGKWRAWATTWQTRGVAGIAGATAGTLLVQGILVAGLYAVGSAVGWLFGLPTSERLGTPDIIALVVYSTLALMLGLLVVRGESMPADCTHSSANS